jgi:mono/diheme cytochrome c family protein
MRTYALFLAAVALGGWSDMLWSDEREVVASKTMGSEHFRIYCATCHGKEAKGDGPLADSLRFRPSDLTLLARRNGGKFDSNVVSRIIDGREPVKGHGGPDMPVWGDAFKNSRDGYSDEKVKEKVDELVEYLRSIQAPPEK